jgi:hypothetical protein
LEEHVNRLKLELPDHEIPGALEKFIDDKHQKELEDLLLKLYEQKAVELKEEILAMMEAKLAKQQEARKGYNDRKKGIDALISRTVDDAEVNKLESQKADLDRQMNAEVNGIEKQYQTKEKQITQDVQKRCQDREVRLIDEL